ncbi:transposon protein [Canna indica]|uniref:Transposon protein n=1 Tax=Canna indica TaxID=4628 RepID=A0AAQ3QCA9_9LILI|nr:transposon protein [Canna indica]
MADTSFDKSGKSITQPTPPTPQTDTIPDNSPRPQISLSSSIVEGNKKRKLTSKVWVHFIKQIIDGQTMGVCNYCTSTLKVSSKNGTSSMHNHVNSCVARKTGQSIVESLEKQKQIAVERITNGTIRFSAFKFDQETSRRELAYAIIVHEYPLAIVDHVSLTSQVSHAQHTDMVDDVDENLHDFHESPGDVVVKSEIDQYLDDGRLPLTRDFDILSWWKSNGLKYPTLQRIARDFPVIPISIVASEAAFSTSGRVVSTHRSRLHPDNLEALMCTKLVIHQHGSVLLVLMYYDGGHFMQPMILHGKLITRKYSIMVGEAEKLVRTLFDVAVARQPFVIFMDEAGIY